MHLYLLISRKIDYINVCMLYIYIDPILPFFPHTIRIDWLKHEKRVSSPYSIFSFYFVLCISERRKKISLCFWRKSNIPWKARWTEGLCLRWENRFSQLVCFILLRLTSMWALYTLKWTLVTLVLMGHYLTYESLRHNQLFFIYKDPLSDGCLPLLPTPLTYLPRLMITVRPWNRALNYIRPPILPHCHLRSC